MAVAEVARRIGEPELLARAALEQGAVLVYARVDARLVSVLEEALAALGGGDSALRAQVMARLAAAQQPADDPARPMALARDAIAMARRVGDEPTLLAVLTSALAALMDFAPPRERLALNREHVMLAERHGAAALALRGSMRLVVDHLELGDVARARDALAACRDLAERIAHPHHQWPVAALEALERFRAGSFEEGERALERARALAERVRDPNAGRGLALQRWWLARLRGDDRAESAAIATLGRSVAGLPFGPLLVTLLGVLAAADRVAIDRLAIDRSGDEPRPPMVSGDDIERLLAMHDLSVLATLAEAALALGDVRLAARVDEQLGGYADRWVSLGLFGLVVGEPVLALTGRLAALLGDRGRAVRLLDEAHELARERGLVPHVAWIAFRLAEVLTGDARDHARAATLLDDAARVAAALALDGLGARIAGLRGRLATSSLAPGLEVRAQPTVDSRGLTFALTRAGELWQLARDGRVVHLKDSKGMRMLAALVEEPGTERHVLDLIALTEGLGGSSATQVDAGDAGELLDGRAREAYRRRVAELREEVEEAERWNDLGRAERASAELHAISEELARGIGLGGRERRAGGAAERARVNVQRRLRDAIRRIEEQDAEVGRYLARCIRTGTYCCFELV
ncbi:MAG: hypothetical protein IPK07_28590 [Deltaproteobacteria bacterium]|nr:hypothetical protein [Deltaproteobacteria bacterium]